MFRFFSCYSNGKSRIIRVVPEKMAVKEEIISENVMTPNKSRQRKNSISLKGVLSISMRGAPILSVTTTTDPVNHEDLIKNILRLFKNVKYVLPNVSEAGGLDNLLHANMVQYAFVDESHLNNSSSSHLNEQPLLKILESFMSGMCDYLVVNENTYSLIISALIDLEEILKQFTYNRRAPIFQNNSFLQNEIFAVTDILLSEVLVALEKKNNLTCSQDFFVAIIKIYNNLKEIVVRCDVGNNAMLTTSLLAQCVDKAVRVLYGISVVCRDCGHEDSSFYSNLNQMLVSLTPMVGYVDKVGGSNGYITRMTFWTLCVALSEAFSIANEGSYPLQQLLDSAYYSMVSHAPIPEELFFAARDPASWFSLHTDRNSMGSTKTRVFSLSVLGFQCLLDVCTIHGNALPRYADWFDSLIGTLLLTMLEGDECQTECVKIGAVLAEMALALSHFNTDTSSTPILDHSYAKLTTMLDRFVGNRRLQNRFAGQGRPVRPISQSIHHMRSMSPDNEEYEDLEVIDNCDSVSALSRGSTSERFSRVGSVSAPSLNKKNSTQALFLPLKFFPGDQVDGLCTLKNGTQRWFPADVLHVLPNGNIHLKFKDGEEQDNKPSSEVRSTKRRGSKRDETIGMTARSNASSTAPVSRSAMGSADSTTRDRGTIVLAMGEDLSGLMKQSSKEDMSGLQRLPTKSSSATVSMPPRRVIPKKPSFNANIVHGLLPSSLVVEAAPAKLDGPKPALSPRSVASDGSEDSEDHIFEIPSVFGDEIDRSVRSSVQAAGVVPIMRFNDLNLTSFAPSMSMSGGAMSLSASLLREDANDVTIDMNKSLGDSSFSTNYAGINNDSSRSNTFRQQDLSARATGRSLGLPTVRSRRQLSRIPSGGDGRSVNMSMSLPLPSVFQSDRAGDWNTEDIISLYWLVNMILLQRCIRDSLFLDERCCVTASKTGNIAFSVRDYMESVQVHDASHLQFAAGIASGKSLACFRLMKLLCPGMFDSSLPSRMATGVRIADGGFGSVFRIKCPDSDVTDNESPASTTYVVKRLTRERSASDAPVIVDVFAEISCLELLAGTAGVCRLVDYGVVGGEYWIVLEAGEQNLEEWRLDRLRSDGVTTEDIKLYLHMFNEIVQIVSNIHTRDVIHFDIKASNIILRSTDFTLESFQESKKANRKGLSNLLFLADFGESKHNVSEDKNTEGVVRARGTLPIQSPEMLRLSQAEKAPPSKPTLDTAQPGRASDIWSLGCLLVQLITGDYLFAGKPWPELYVLLCLQESCSLPLNGLKSVLTNSGMHSDICRAVETLVTQILTKRVSERPKASQVLTALKSILRTFRRGSSASSPLPPSPSSVTSQSSMPSPPAASLPLHIGERDSHVTKRQSLPLTILSDVSVTEDIFSFITLSSGLWRLSDKVWVQVLPDSIGNKGGVNAPGCKTIGLPADFDLSGQSPSLSIIEAVSKKTEDVEDRLRTAGISRLSSSLGRAKGQNMRREEAVKSFVFCDLQNPSDQGHNGSILVPCTLSGDYLPEMLTSFRAKYQDCLNHLREKKLGHGRNILFTIPSMSSQRTGFQAFEYGGSCVSTSASITTAVTMACAVAVGYSEGSHQLDDSRCPDVRELQEMLDRRVPALRKYTNRSLMKVLTQACMS